MTAQPSNRPRDHLFVPKLLLERRANSEGLLRLWRRRPNGLVSSKLVPPETTAIERDLYSVTTVPPAERQWIETHVLAHGIEKAGKAVLLKLIDGLPPTEEERRAVGTAGQGDAIAEPHLLADDGDLHPVVRAVVAEAEMARSMDKPSVSAPRT